MQQVYGKPLYQCIRAYKMRVAARLLRETDRTVLDIAGEFGYGNSSKFAAAFREVLGARTYETAATTDHPEGQILSNWFLRRIEDKDTGGITVTGAKTGYVVESGNCAASYGEAADGHRYICVTADAASSWLAIYDHAALYKAYCSPDAAAEDDGDGAADSLAESVPPAIDDTTEHESGASL